MRQESTFVLFYNTGYTVELKQGTEEIMIDVYTTKLQGF